MSVIIETLAIDGGTPVRNRDAPWPSWPRISQTEWSRRIEPALKQVYFSGVEGLPAPTSATFARKFAEYCGAEHGQMVVHGTDAIAAALTGALDLHACDDAGEVILPNYTFIATASAPLDRRCTLALVDIDSKTFTIDPDAIERAIRPGETKAILPVHLGGHPADMERIMEIARKHGLKVIEDCAQSHGAICAGRKVGSHGDAAAFSFQSSKGLTSGEGGAVTTNDPEIHARVAAFKDVGRHPSGEQWEYPRLGWNYRPSEYLAALLLVRLDDLEAQVEHRCRMAALLNAELSKVPGITTPHTAAWCTRHAYHLYAVLVDPLRFGGRSRNDVVDALNAEGIPARRGYRTPLSEQPALLELRQRHPRAIRTLDCPNVQFTCNHSIWFVQTALHGDEQDMADIVRGFEKVQRGFGGGAEKG